MVYAESLDGSKFDECSITVNGSAEMKAADRESDFVFSALSAEDLQKINSLIFRNFYQFALTNEFDSESFTSASERRFSLIANVAPGTEIQESVRAQEVGLTDVRVLENINAITFQGTFSQILIFVTDNADLREITGGGLHFIDKPIQLENEGDKITFIKKDDSMDIYTVYANEKIADTDFDTLNQIAESAENAVIFITCEDERVEGGYANRRIVAAMPK